MIIVYRLPLPSAHLPNNHIIVARTCSLDCFLTDGREVEIGNKSCWFLQVCAKKDIADTNILMIDPNLTETVETLERGDPLAYCVSVDCVPSAAHSAALSSSTSDMYDIRLLP